MYRGRFPGPGQQAHLLGADQRQGHVPSPHSPFHHVSPHHGAFKSPMEASLMGQYASPGGRLLHPSSPGARQANTPNGNRVHNTVASPGMSHAKPSPYAYTNGAAVTSGSAHKAIKHEDPPEEDQVGHYQVEIGLPIKLLGSGTYGKVVKCEDVKYNKTHVAIKLVRSEPPLYCQSAKNEINILRELDGRYGTLKLLRDFDHLGHVCMSFELLGDHISDVLKAKGPFSREHIRDVTFQLLQAMAYVHGKNIIHTDLKAENILLMQNPCGALSVKVADFGSAIYNSAWHPPLVGTMHYRAPEAVLQAGWSYPLDVWAIACLAMELRTGDHVFELVHDDIHLRMMINLLGPIPQALIEQGFSMRNQYNAPLLQLDPTTGKVQLAPMINGNPQNFAHIRKVPALQKLIGDRVLVDLLVQMLEYDPDRRITADKALLHPFFDLDEEDDLIDGCDSPIDGFGDSTILQQYAPTPPMQQMQQLSVSDHLPKGYTDVSHDFYRQQVFQHNQHGVRASAPHHAEQQQYEQNNQAFRPQTMGNHQQQQHRETKQPPQSPGQKHNQHLKVQLGLSPQAPQAPHPQAPHAGASPSSWSQSQDDSPAAQQQQHLKLQLGLNGGQIPHGAREMSPTTHQLHPREVLRTDAQDHQRLPAPGEVWM